MLLFTLFSPQVDEEMEKRLLEYVLKLFTACEFWFIQVASYPR